MMPTAPVTGESTTSQPKKFSPYDLILWLVPVILVLQIAIWFCIFTERGVRGIAVSVVCVDRTGCCFVAGVLLAAVISKNGYLGAIPLLALFVLSVASADEETKACQLLAN